MQAVVERIAVRSETPTRNRIAALDFTKGVLVLLMVFYHWLNYFVSPDLDYRYLRFLTPSFIFVTGFLIAHVYFSNSNSTDCRLAKRLFTRGMKLLLVFLVLNVMRSVALPILTRTAITLSDQFKAQNLWAIGIVGNVPVTSSRIVAFYILIPIAYLLLLSAALWYGHRVFKHVFHLACLLCLAGILVLGFQGERSYNLEYITIGLLGVIIGFYPLECINNFVRHPVALLIGYIFYLVAIRTWNVPFPLLAVGVCLSVSIIYLAGLQKPESSRGGRHVILLGKHSLFSYVVQIAILQILSAGLRRVHLGVAVTLISFGAAFAMTMLAVEIAERLKTRFELANRLYKLAFA